MNIIKVSQLQKNLRKLIMNRLIVFQESVALKKKCGDTIFYTAPLKIKKKTSSVYYFNDTIILT